MRARQRPASLGAGLGDERPEAQAVLRILRADGLDRRLGEAADAEEGGGRLHGAAARRVAEFARRAGAEGDVAVARRVDRDARPDAHDSALRGEVGADDAGAVHDRFEEVGVEEDADARLGAEIVEDELQRLGVKGRAVVVAGHMPC